MKKQLLKEKQEKLQKLSEFFLYYSNNINELTIEEMNSLTYCFNEIEKINYTLNFVK